MYIAQGILVVLGHAAIAEGGDQVASRRGDFTSEGIELSSLEKQPSASQPFHTEF
jgi:hypothetical protein